ncbi:MAG: endo-1,4-beta-xylanase [Prolixibacteraceae bacterium]
MSNIKRMNIIKHIFFLSILMNLLLINVAANDSINSNLKPIIIEAESGQLGSGFSTLKDGNITYVTAKENFAGQSFPDDTIRMISYQVSFQDTGTYQLFARVNVGSGGYNDDSFFASNGFGPKGEQENGAWVMVNGLAAAGYTASNDVVKDLGSVGSEVWKWVNISQNFYAGGSSNLAFTVNSDEIIKTFQIGSREDGLQFDKFAFGRTDLFYWVEALDNNLPGFTEIPIDSNLYQGPPLAEGSPKFLGNVKDWDDDNFLNIWNQITPGNEGKWSSIAGSSQDTTKWNWSGLDNLYNYAQENGMVFKDHTLIWGAQQPSWINSLSNEKQLMYIETWMRQVGQRYPDMEMVDVVNEAIRTHNPPDGQNGRANYKEALGGDGATGYDWVVKAFELARKYMPADTKLLLNDYGIINDNNATSIYLQMINLLIEKKVIDGIGVQCHRFEIQNASTTTLKYNLDRLAATGLPIYISEMDLGDGSGDDVAPYDDNLQLQKYKDIFPIFWEHPSVAGVTLWGSLEDRMWQKTCHVINSDNSWRPALEWIADYIAKTPVEIKLVEVTSNVEISKEYYEVECAQVGGNWRLFTDDQASNGYYLSAKEGLSSNTVPKNEDDFINLAFSVGAASDYSVYLRVNCPTTSSDSYWLVLDDNSTKAVSGLKSVGWEWKSAAKFTLTAGEHVLKIAYRENGALIDKICISNSLFPPTEMGEEAENKCENPDVASTVEIFSLADIQIYPNPMNVNTSIQFTLKTSASVSLKIYDLIGQEVATLIDKNMNAGSHQLIWNANNSNGSKLSKGTYICKLVTGNNSITRKILLVE